MAAEPVRRIAVLAHGRSGSTLLQSIFLSRCDALTFFEPCRHSPLGDVRRGRCIAQVLRFLRCDLPERDGRWDPPAVRGWLMHPYREANTTCQTLPPFTSVRATAQACRRAKLLLVKEIRLVGQLSQLAAALVRERMEPAAAPTTAPGAAATSTAPGATALIHVVRDPRAMLASQKRLRWWPKWHGREKGTRRQQLAEMERVASHQCNGMLSDAAAGDALQRRGHVRYVLVRFEELSSDVQTTTGRLYAQLGLPVPHETRAWLERTRRGQCVNSNATVARITRNSSAAEQFEYGTCRTSATRRDRWKHMLRPTEKRILARVCAEALSRFGYTDLE